MGLGWGRVGERAECGEDDEWDDGEMDCWMVGLFTSSWPLDARTGVRCLRVQPTDAARIRSLLQ